MRPDQPSGGRLARAWRLIAHQHTDPWKLAVAVGVGVFVGLTPFYFLHSLLAAGLAWALRLNIAVAVLGTQVANPFFAPGLIVASVWVGNALGGPQGGASSWSPADPAFWASWLRGGLVLGTLMGTGLGLLTYAGILLARSRRRDA
ncbi:MAG TPA: DUF2062 domain-containing protein [Candidatus Polarisedimenticolia bacterium]|nr:DUF2062 domain-containing protein [Candidatus Polarisedimenticolia bacterium]